MSAGASNSFYSGLISQFEWPAPPSGVVGSPVI